METSYGQIPSEGACVCFDYDFYNPQPPECPLTQEVTPWELADTDPFLPDDPAQSSLLIQMFLSELQETHTSSKHAPMGLEARSDIPTALDIQEEAEPEYDPLIQLHSSSGVSSSVGLSPHSLLEYIPKTNTTTSATNPLQSSLDDLFLSNFTDVFLEEVFPTDSFSCHLDPLSPPSTLSTTPEPVSDPSPPLVLVDVQTVVSSSLCDKTADQRLLDLSDCVALLDTNTSAPSPTSSTPSPTSSTPSPTSSTPSPTSSIPSPTSSIPSPTSSIPSPTSSSFSSRLSSPSSCTSPTSSKSNLFLSTPSSPNNAHLDHLSITTKRSGKRKESSGSSSEESIPVKLCRVSSRPSASSTSNTAHRPPSIEEKKVRMRRDKNNVASQVSRAKRRQRQQELQRRAEELVPANEELRKKVEELVAETDALRNMLLHKLAQH